MKVKFSATVDNHLAKVAAKGWTSKIHCRADQHFGVQIWHREIPKPKCKFHKEFALKLGHQFGSQAGATSKLELTLKLNKCKTEDYLCIVEQPWNNVKTLGPTKIGKETRSVRAPSKNLVSKPSRKMASTKVWRFAWWREGRSKNWKLGKSLKRVIVPVISCNFLDEPFKRTPVKPALYEQESSDDDIGDIC